MDAILGLSSPFSTCPRATESRGPGETLMQCLAESDERWRQSVLEATWHQVARQRHYDMEDMPRRVSRDDKNVLE